MNDIMCDICGCGIEPTEQNFLQLDYPHFQTNIRRISVCYSCFSIFHDDRHATTSLSGTINPFQQVGYITSRYLVFRDFQTVTKSTNALSEFNAQTAEIDDSIMLTLPIKCSIYPLHYTWDNRYTLVDRAKKHMKTDYPVPVSSLQFNVLCNVIQPVPGYDVDLNDLAIHRFSKLIFDDTTNTWIAGFVFDTADVPVTQLSPLL